MGRGSTSVSSMGKRRRKRGQSRPAPPRKCGTCGGLTRTVLGAPWCDTCSGNPSILTPKPLRERARIRHPVGEGKHVDEWGFYDLENWDQETQSEPPFRRLTSLISLREHVLDEWARTERLLRAVLAILTPGQSREDAWKSVGGTRTRSLIESVAQRVRDDGNDPDEDFESALWDLYQLRNLLAHNDSRALPLAPKSGVRVLQTLQFNKGVYRDVLNDEMERKTKRAYELASWLNEHYPEGDGVRLRLEDDEVARLIAEIPEEP